MWKVLSVLHNSNNNNKKDRGLIESWLIINFKCYEVSKLKTGKKNFGRTDKLNKHQKNINGGGFFF